MDLQSKIILNFETFLLNSCQRYIHTCIPTIFLLVLVCIDNLSASSNERAKFGRTTMCARREILPYLWSDFK